MIRPALPEEFPQLLDIQIGCIHDSTEVYTADEIKAWVEYLEKEGANRYASYNSQVFVGEGDTLAGFVSWSQNEAEHAAAVECLYVKKQDRGQGIGKMLLQEAEVHIADGITIHVRSTLNARSFYERNGYEYVVGDAISRAGFAIALLEKRS